jgi:hypothetical protein
MKRSHNLIAAGMLLLPMLALAADPELDLTGALGKVGAQPGPFVVHLNCGDGKQTAKLLKRKGVVVQGLDTSRENVEKARRTPTLRGVYGNRITFAWFDGRNLPFIDNCVNAIVVSSVPPSPAGSAAASRCRVSGEEIRRVLAPRGAAVGPPSCIPHPATRIGNGFVVFTKPVPSDIDDWTHHMHGPDNNRVSQGTRLAPPLSHLQWTAGPRFTRHHEHMSSFQAMVSAGGKVPSAPEADALCRSFSCKISERCFRIRSCSEGKLASVLPNSPYFTLFCPSFQGFRPLNCDSDVSEAGAGARVAGSSGWGLR